MSIELTDTTVITLQDENNVIVSSDSWVADHYFNMMAYIIDHKNNFEKSKSIDVQLIDI